MAFDTLPLFVTDTAGVPDFVEMKARMRLSGLKVDEDAEQIVHSAIQGVRTKIYGRLGISRVAAIVSTNPVAAPTTEEEILRAVAYECEILWVVVDLMCRLPMIFMDDGSSVDEIYNQEGAFRSMEAFQVERCRKIFNAQIEEWLSVLAKEVSLGDVGGPNRGRVYTQIPQAPKLYPAGSLRGDNVVLFTNPEVAKAMGLTT